MDPTATLLRGRRRGRHAQKKRSTFFVIGALLIALLPPLTFVVPADAATLTNINWGASSGVAGATNVTYSYGFIAPTAGNVSSVAMTVPSGTSGTPTVLSASVYAGYSIGLSNQTVTLSGTTLTFSFSSTYFPADTVITLEIGGITNTSTPGSYPSTITTQNGSTTVDSGTADTFTITATALTGLYWTASSTTTGTGSVTYSYQFTTTTATPLSQVTIAVPAGTAGTPTVVAATPSAISGGTVSLTGQKLSYTFASTSVASGTVITLQFGGLTNTTTRGSYARQIVTLNGSSPVDSGVTAPLAFTTTALTALSWSASSTTVGATGTAYTFQFTTGAGQTLTGADLSVPPGTSGTPAVGTISANAGYNIPLPSPTVTLAGTTLSFSFAATYLAPSTVVSIQITGLTNTATPGSYASSIATITNQSPTGPYDSGTAPAVTFTASAAALTAPSWSADSTTVNATGVTYSYAFGLSADATLSTVTMSVPAGTAGTPTVGSVSPPSIAGGTVSLSGQTLTYTFTAAAVTTASTISIQIGGLTNTPTRSTIASTIVAYNGATVVGSGTTPSVSFTAAGLTALSWSASNTAAGATGSAYTYGFTTGTSATLDHVTMAVPSGTGGTPAVGTVSAQSSYAITLASPIVTLSGTTLSFSFTPVSVPVGTVISIEITGMTNTSTAGSYPSAITTFTADQPLPGPVDSGTAPAAVFTSTTLTAVSWSASSTSVGATGVSYTYSFGFSATSTISSLTMSVPPGTGGTPMAGTITPSSIGGGTVSLSGQTLTYTLPAPVSISDTSTLTIQITGITNSSTSSVYAASITAYNGAAVVASATTPPVTFTSVVLTSLSWTATSTTTTTTGVTYSYNFTASAATLTSVTMTVPAGTGGTPALGTVSIYDPVQGAIITPANQTISLSGTTITFSFAAQYFGNNTTFQIDVTGMTNTSAAGTYTSAITTKYNTTALASGTTPSLSFSSTSLGTPVWSVTSTAIGATGQGYDYSFIISNSSSLGAVAMSLPAGTGGVPTVGAVSPSAVAGGTVSMANNTLTYSFPPTTLPVGTSVSITINGLTNTSTSGTYTSTITVMDSGTAILASGVTTSVSFTSTVLTGMTWTQSSLRTNATGVTYTYEFTTSSNSTLTGVTMTVPNGTGGTPVLGAATATDPSSVNIPLDTPSITLVGTTINLSFHGVWVPSGSVFSIQVTGMTNTSLPANYTSAITTKNSGATIDSGITSATTFVGGPLVGTTWSTSRTVAGSDKTSYSYTFTTASTSQLSSITMSVPPGTGGTPLLGAVTPAAVANGANVALSGDTLTVSFTPTTVSQGTAISVQVDGLNNTSSVGLYTSSVATVNATASIDTAVSNTVTLVAPNLSFSNTCLTPAVSCSVDANGATQVVLLAIPGWTTPTSASVTLSVQTNATDGYRVLARSSILSRMGGGATLDQAPTSGAASISAGQFSASATLIAAPSSGATLCSPYGSSTPQVGYSTTATSASIWAATAGTGTGTDTIILTNAVKVAATQAAGTYTGTIVYTVQPMYVGNSAC